jgi:hypothetical protein
MFMKCLNVLCVAVHERLNGSLKLNNFITLEKSNSFKSQKRNLFCSEMPYNSLNSAKLRTLGAGKA